MAIVKTMSTYGLKNPLAKSTKQQALSMSVFSRSGQILKKTLKTSQKKQDPELDDLDQHSYVILFANAYGKSCIIFLIRFHLYADRSKNEHLTGVETKYVNQILDCSPKGSLTLTFLLATTWSGMDLRWTDFKAGKPWGKVPRKGDAVVVMLMVAIAAVCPLLFPYDFYTTTAVLWQFSHALGLPLLAGRRV
jgi:hypothetical protein